jgi:type III pantothenate kinase
MLLVIDIGNTDIVFGFYAENTWKAILRTPTHQPWSPLRLQMWLVRELKEKGFESYQPDSILISSVVPSVLPQIQKGIDFWSKELKIPISQFKKTYVKKNKFSDITTIVYTKI